MHIIRQMWKLQYRLSLPAIDLCLYYPLLFFPPITKARRYNNQHPLCVKVFKNI